mmetsp:Transcript_26506/g.49545  ORF Transcript_26506/g.49545 Transcript_26506/m.49545 type:complete len:201 (-) Transcript_26506:249-851(-)|eukprot:CAMPEP_0170168260 /NCGR_PEP_ID=MMETSP0040_2-20121228/1369_1 /TAXON_ID=641309 /ORGANISM="Lotharella oceanica, Strain CCMP622" /LENGTH=200 /DNA_ID=CAMNT_0010406467 /DNA_START=37 /DNA_END=639 /DNA_ORIENTATION=-
MASIDSAELKAKVYEILKTADLGEFTKKDLRLQLENDFGLKKNGLKPRKGEINKYLEKYLEEHNNDDDDAAEEEEEEEEPPPPKKRAKKRKTPPPSDDEKKKEPTHSCITRTGAVVPKKLKDRQSDLMSSSEFMNGAEPLEIEIWGNKLKGLPRSFTSGNLGWYLCGKIEVPINGHTVWAQAGLNITIPGSKEWENDEED